MISRPEAQAKFREYWETLGSHDEVFTDGSKMNERLRLRLRQNLFNKNMQVPYQVHMSFLEIQITL